jgi:hypothetical protein
LFPGAFTSNGFTFLLFDPAGKVSKPLKLLFELPNDILFARVLVALNGSCPVYGELFGFVAVFVHAMLLTTVIYPSGGDKPLEQLCDIALDHVVRSPIILRAKDVTIGPESYMHWNDADTALIRAIWCLVRHRRPIKVVEQVLVKSSRFILEALNEKLSGKSLEHRCAARKA